MKRVENKEFLELISDSRPAQQEAIMADEDLVVVSAGAGTGKTETLARRYAWLVTTGRAKFNQILTLTFTEKAALEMRERIRMRLRNWYKQLSNQGNFQPYTDRCPSCPWKNHCSIFKKSDGNL